MINSIQLFIPTPLTPMMTLLLYFRMVPQCGNYITITALVLYHLWSIRPISLQHYKILLCSNMFSRHQTKFAEMSFRQSDSVKVKAEREHTVHRPIQRKADTKIWRASEALLPVSKRKKKVYQPPRRKHTSYNFDITLNGELMGSISQRLIKMHHCNYIIQCLLSSLHIYLYICKIIYIFIYTHTIFCSMKCRHLCTIAQDEASFWSCTCKDLDNCCRTVGRLLQQKQTVPCRFAIFFLYLQDFIFIARIAYVTC